MLFIMSFSFGVGYKISAINANETYVIMFDEAHGQYFNSTMMKSALDALNNLSSGLSEIQVEIIFNKGSRFNSTNLQGVDLLIITNPGINESSEFSSDEIDAILDYVELGGSLFLLSNPLTHDENITGHASILNSILSGRDNLLTTARIRTGTNITHSSVILDDFNHVYGNESYVHYTTFDSNNHTIFNQEYKIQNITLYSTSIEMGNEDEKYAIGRTLQTAYSVDEEYEIFRDPIKNYLTWLFAKEIGDSRLVISGSTIMFSDMYITENHPWINEEQNLQLWKNIILWLLKITPHEEPIVFPVLSFGYFAVIVVVISFIIFGVSIITYKLYEKRKEKISIK